jgi:geranylgeranyl reductase family protein
MIRADAIVVGGGPSGSTCARVLRRAGWNVVVMDRARFPRDKVCAGWLTPGVFSTLELDPGEYRAAGLTLEEITAFRTGVLDRSGERPVRRLIETRYERVVSYAIRRCEFDDFLLRRAGVRVLDNTPVKTIRREADRWIVNDTVEAPVLVGAGGHFCPVAKHLADRGGTVTTIAAAPVVAKEAEFRVPNRAADPPELLFCNDLEGYGWCVRKGDYLNVGIGRRESRNFSDHVQRFVALLESTGVLEPGAPVKWRGHAYYATGVGPRPLVAPGALVVGDSAGLAYPESGEGIHPAIASGRLAAETLIAAGHHFGVDELTPYAEALRRQHPPASRPPAAVRNASAAIGRALLGSSLFTRHMLLDRWFLRMPSAARAASA